MVSSVNHISTWYVHLHSGLPFTHLYKLRVLKIFIKNYKEKKTVYIHKVDPRTVRVKVPPGPITQATRRVP